MVWEDGINPHVIVTLLPSVSKELDTITLADNKGSSTEIGDKNNGPDRNPVVSPRINRKGEPEVT